MQDLGKLTFLIASFSILLLATGCREKGQEADVPPGKSSEVICTNAQSAVEVKTNSLDSVVFCVVDGVGITAEFVRDTVLVKAKISELGGKKKVPEGLLHAWGNSYAMKIVPELISAKLMEDEARRSGISATESSDAQTLAKYNRATNSRADTKESLAEKFGDLKGAFLRQFDDDSLRLAYFSTFPQLSVTDEDVEVFYLNLTNTIRKLSQIDEEARRKADLAYNRLVAGEDWAVVARECSEDAEVSKDNVGFSKEWGLFRPKDLQPVELASAVSLLQDGKFTSPIETDDGLVIAKLLYKEGESLGLARILIRLPIRLDVPPREVAERRIAMEKNVEFQLELLPKLREKAKIEYPLGTNFVYHIWELPKKEKKPRKPKTNKGVPGKKSLKSYLEAKGVDKK